MLFQTWIDVTVGALQSLWEGFILFIPNIIGAIVILLVGWIIAVGLDKLVSRIIDVLKIDLLLEKFGVDKILQKGGVKLNSGKFFGFIIKWFIILAFLTAAVNTLNLTSVNIFLMSVLNYIPSLIAAILILLVTVWLADFLQKLVQTSIAAMTDVKKVGMIGMVTKWTVLVFGFLAALTQLGIAQMLIQTVITGLIAMLAIAGGLALGLGGKDAAADMIREVKRELSE